MHGTAFFIHMHCTNLKSFPSPWLISADIKQTTTTNPSFQLIVLGDMHHLPNDFLYYDCP